MSVSRRVQEAIVECVVCHCNWYANGADKTNARASMVQRLCQHVIGSDCMDVSPGSIIMFRIRQGWRMREALSGHPITTAWLPVTHYRIMCS